MGVLEGKVAVVTGAGRGLGRAYAMDASAQGAKVVAVDVDGTTAADTAAAIEEAEGSALAIQADVADPDQCARAIERCIAEFGRIDGLVNNAGISPLNLPPWEYDVATTKAIVEVNLLGTIYCGTFAMPHMIKQRSGSIVNVTSITQLGYPGFSVYGAAKGGVASLTYVWSLELAQHGIRVNCMSPFARSVITPGFDAGGPEPETNAPVVSYLLSDLAEGVTGQVFRISNGTVSIVGHPAVLPGGVIEPTWTPEALAAAVRGPLKGSLQKSGP